ncbi:unnamed protein product [Adineta steineri]|uniref:RecQ-like DNA helicase BLM n=1 Tax=Adineta steineri TaxID=433720 RepID=A0A813UYJ0_9BILA|nr:unnamed protein product [Adineta steineri]CAF0864974.1 unnamed protein product [Adineta steineri]
MIDRAARIKNNLSEQLKLFYDYTKDVQTKVIKPNPLPLPIFRLNTDIIPVRKSLPLTISNLPRLSLAIDQSNVNISHSSVKEATVTTPSRDLSKLSLNLNNSAKATSKTESSSVIQTTESSSVIKKNGSPSVIKKTQTSISSFLNAKFEPKTISPSTNKLQTSISSFFDTKSEPKTTSPPINKFRTSITSASPSLPKKIEAASSSSLCPLCTQPYDPISRRPISEDSCGHTMCLQCFIFKNNQNGCIQCAKIEKENFLSKTTVKDDDFADFDQNQLFDEWNEEESLELTNMDTMNSIYDDDTEEGDESDEENLIDIKPNPYKVQWLSDIKDDAAEFSSDHTYPHTQTLFEVFDNIFGLKQFRSNQLEAINAALLHHDCFVLMPTGGGKSLCYQLPAVMDKGVTFIISPLRSLIYDQKQKLVSLGIECGALTSDVSQREVDEVYRELYKHTPGLKIVYVTPEKIAKSDQLTQLLKNLYERKLLARFVIDECHCVSEWGHDFRPDYASLGQLRVKYPGINVILLTATATPRVQKDILQQMKININQCKLFIQSFNRSNLIYECALKGTTDTALKKVANLIISHYNDKCGIVYCFSRAECDKTAKYLSAYKINALPYHAGLSDSKRQLVQNQWANDDCQVICATIAFGMGIDKPNVRFVIHLSMPKSIEGYYQESGRAGRDGEISYCYLFFCYQDLVKMKRLILNDDGQTSTKEAKKVRVDNLNRVYDYCLNNVTCRRTQLLEYFGELFPSSECKRMKRTVCDNCRQVLKTTSINCTQMSIEIIKLVSEFLHKNITLPAALDILRGANTKGIRDAGHNNLAAYNSCNQLSRVDLERLVCRLILEGYLLQEIVTHQQQSFESSAAYLRLGPKAHMALSNQSNRFMNPIELTIRTEQSNITNDEKRKQQTPVEQLNEQCLKELKKELKSIFGQNSHAMIIPERAIKEMVKLMPRTKEAMIKDVNEITEERYKRHELHRLLAITQRFGKELDEIKRKEENARKALLQTTTSKRKLTLSDEEQEDIDFSTDADGFIKVNKQGKKTNGHYNRFVKSKKRPASFFARKNAIAKRKRGGF